jgi:hypothetical protein
LRVEGRAGLVHKGKRLQYFTTSLAVYQANTSTKKKEANGVMLNVISAMDSGTAKEAP